MGGTLVNKSMVMGSLNLEGITDWVRFNKLMLRQNGRHCADEFLDSLSCMKTFAFVLKSHWSLFVGQINSVG